MLQSAYMNKELFFPWDMTVANNVATSRYNYFYIL